MSSDSVARVESLSHDLRALGVGSGECVLVHASLRSVGTVERGAEGLVDALLDAVGPTGNLIAPTFTYRSARFDPGTTPGRTGAVGEALRCRPAAIRSLHPFYSVAASGPRATELTRGHELVPGTGIGSPLDRLAAAGGLVLLLGVGHDRSTTIHVGEFHADAPYLDIPFDPAWPTDAEVVTGDQTRYVSYDRFPGCSRAFGLIEPHLRARRAIHDGRVGLADAQLVEGTAVIEETVALLARDEAALLCADAGCYRCSRGRARFGL